MGSPVKGTPKRAACCQNGCGAASFVGSPEVQFPAHVHAALEEARLKGCDETAALGRAGQGGYARDTLLKAAPQTARAASEIRSRQQL